MTVPDWASERWSVVVPPPAPWGSAILAKPGLPVSAANIDWQGGFRQGVLLATAGLELPGGGTLTLGSVHAVVGRVAEDLLAEFDPSLIKRPREPVPYPNDVAYAVFRRRVAGKRFLVSGDWNIARLWDEHHPRTHEADFFTRAESDGWVDCYRVFHPQEGRTWFRGLNVGYQLDHAFCDAETAKQLTGCYIEPEPSRGTRAQRSRAAHHRCCDRASWHPSRRSVACCHERPGRARSGTATVA